MDTGTDIDTGMDMDMDIAKYNNEDFKRKCACDIDGWRLSNSIYLIIIHLGAIYSVQYITPSILFEIILFYQISAIGITAGLHRLWSHRSYKARLPTRIFLMILVSFASQGSIYNWVRDHRIHHKYSDTNADPHNSNNGFFFSHMGWLITKKDKEVIKAYKTMDCSDLKDDRVVMFNYYLWPYNDLFMNLIVTGIYGHYFHDSFFEGVLLFGLLRLFILSHATWCVNSVAHTFGHRPFRKNIKPTENVFVSLIGAGEGWHNWHHTYPYDYAASDEGILLRWNPTKLFIDILGFFGQTYDHKRKIK